VLRAGTGTLLAVVLLSINLRTLFASLPPLLAEVRAEFGLSAGVAGLLTTGPVLCLGALGPFAPRLARRISIEWLIVACGLVTAAGMLLRGTGSLAALFAGTMFAGAAISVAQVALPVLIRSRHPGQVGVFTGAYSMALTLGSTVSAGLAVPLEHLLGSWERSLAFWGVPMLVALLPWFARLRGAGTFVEGPRVPPFLREPLALSVTLFFVLQGMAFYAGLTWLPTFLRDEGWSAEAAGTLQAVANGVGFLPAFLLPFFAGRMRTQGPLLVGVAAVGLAGLAGLLLEPDAAVVWMPVLGLSQGGALGLGLILPVLRGGDVRMVAVLTGMTLSMGYFFASAGPWLLGFAHDLAGGWTIPLLLLAGITALQIPAGLPATRDRTLAAK
jgi:CP family cyanate transporter-like MFS transporter